VAKPFTMALVMEDQGVDAVKQKIGVEPTGMPFNSIIAIELNDKRSINPLVNAGASAAVMLMAGFYDEVGKWAFRAGLPAKTGVGGGILDQGE
jgi:glutaminase